MNFDPLYGQQSLACSGSAIHCKNRQKWVNRARKSTGIGGCVTCHSYNDQGGNVGPALDAVSSRLNGDALERALLNPSASIVSGYEARVVERQDGSVIQGRYRNDSDLAVQIQSEDGTRWVTYFKDRVKSVTASDESLMPDVYSDLGAAEQQLMTFFKSL